MVFCFRAVRGLSQAFYSQGRPACAASSTQESHMDNASSYQWPWWSQCWLRTGLSHFLLGFPMANTHMYLCTVCTQELTPVTQFTVGALCSCTVEIQSVQAHRPGPTATSFIHSVTMPLPVTPGSCKLLLNCKAAKLWNMTWSDINYCIQNTWEAINLPIDTGNDKTPFPLFRKEGMENNNLHPTMAFCLLKVHHKMP